MRLGGSGPYVLFKIESMPAKPTPKEKEPSSSSSWANKLASTEHYESDMNLALLNEKNQPSSMLH